MFTLETVSRPVANDEWQTKLAEIARTQFAGALQLVSPEEQNVSIVRKSELEQHKSLTIYQMLDLQKGLVELQTNILSPGYSLRPNRIIIRSPRVLLMGFERSHELEADLVAIRSLLTNISGRHAEPRTNYTNVRLGSVVGQNNEQTGIFRDIIHVVTDHVMPTHVNFGRLVIDSLRTEQHQSRKSILTLS